MATFGKTTELTRNKRPIPTISGRSSAYEMAHNGGSSSDATDGTYAHLSVRPSSTLSSDEQSLDSSMPGGFSNNAYASSVVDVRGHGRPARHSTAASATQVDSQKAEELTTAVRLKAFAGVMVAIIILFLVTAAVLLYLWLGTDTFTKKPVPGVDPVHSYGFSGEIAINNSWSDSLYNVSSAAYRNLSGTFLSAADSAFVNVTAYNRTELLNFRPGSIIAVFRVFFTKPLLVEEAHTIIKNAFQSLPISFVMSSLVVDLPNLESPCGTDFFHCDNTCLYKSYQCNGGLDCTDWADEVDCPNKSVTCTFEQPGHCGYRTESTNSFYNWLPKSGPTGTSGTGPSLDHTLSNLSGVYFYTEATCFNCDYGEVTRLITPRFSMLTTSCVTFYYNMRGSNSGMGSLSLLALSPADVNEPLMLWTRQGNVSSAWLMVSVQLPPATAYELIFESIYGGSFLGDKAIDDVNLVKGFCTPVQNCSGGGQYCPLTATCIVASQMCDGWFDCPDLSDELNCKGYLVSCSFESQTLCNLVQGNTSAHDYVWSVSKGKEPGSIPGSYFDKTLGNEFGALAHVDGNNGNTGSTSQLLTTTLQGNEVLCLQLYYLLLGRSGSLAVVTVADDGSPLTTLWSVSSPWSPLSPTWRRLQLTVASRAHNFRIAFTATKGNGDIALDEIILQPGFCQYAVGVSLCPSGRQIPNEWICDGEADCTDRSDEAYCGVCSAGSFQCKDYSCVDGGSAITCDGVYDCADGSDEQLPCAKSVSSYGVEIIRMYDSRSATYSEVCFDGWRDSLSDLVCSYLGIGFKGQASPTSNASGASSYYLSVNAPASSSGRISYSNVSQCSNNRFVSLVCDADICGQTADAVVPYLIGGSNADTTSHPWQVSLRINAIGHNCGGTLIGPRWVISAAHCFDGGRQNSPHIFSALLGSTSVDPGSPGTLVLSIAKIVLHPLYTTADKGYDIALILLNETVDYTDLIRPACLSNDGKETFSSRSICYLTGWGIYQTSPSVFPTYLQSAKTKIYPSTQCNETQFYRGIISSTLQVCAGYQLGQIRTCKGDSGGPLTCFDSRRRWQLYGVTSFGPPTCDVTQNAPDVFTRVPAFINWLTNVSSFVFVCDNGLHLYDDLELCDGVDNCGDSSDELRPCNQSVSCSFDPPEHLCGWRSHRNGWIPLLESATPRFAGNGGPSFDHTAGLSGAAHVYLFAPAGSYSIFESPLYNETSVHCLRFYYHLLGKDAGTLSVLLTDQVGLTLDRTPKLQWYNGGDLGDMWLLGQIEVPPGEYRITFNVSVPALASGGIGLDDVVLTAGTCPSKACASASSDCSCKDGLSCVARALRCDLVCHCGDCSDEIGCGGPMMAACTFSEPFACGLRQRADDDFNWASVAAESLVASLTATGPVSGGHTLVSVNSSTSTAFTDKFYLAMAPEEHVRATSMWPIRLNESIESYCLSFYYCMHGVDVGLLQVFADAANVSAKVWELWGNKGPDWALAMTNVSSRTTLVTFATQSAGSVYNHVALDDLDLRSGPCGTISCPTLMWACPNECINMSRMCDGLPDCSDLSDEKLCPWGGAYDVGGLSCDFEDGSSCGYTLVPDLTGDYKWLRVTGALRITNADELAMSADSSLKNSAGHYMFLDSKQGRDNSSAYVLFPALYFDQDGGCVVFDYAVSGDLEGVSELRAYVNDTRIRNVTYLWPSTRLSADGQWKKALVSLPPGVSSVGFEARFGGSNNSALFLDGVNITKGPCHVSFLCLPTMFACVKDLVCINRSAVCDGIFNCLDRSDEANCSGSEFDCDFESSLCSWQSNSWRRRQGTAMTDNNGPRNDHTFGNDLGQYLYSPASSSALLVSGFFNYSTTHCLTLYYYLVGMQAGTLQVNVGTKTLLNISGSQGLSWWHASFPIVPGSSPQQVKLMAVAQLASSTTSAHGGIAVDDIIVREGNCDCTNGFRCDSLECLDKSVSCDFTPQCSDGSDEPDLCPCPDGDFQCSDDSCKPVKVVCEHLDFKCLSGGLNISCDCTPSEFQCDNGLCVHLASFCDTHNDCGDSSDESPNCTEIKAAKYFECGELYTWLPWSQVCDGTHQCPDGKDEANCSVATSSLVAAAGSTTPALKSSPISAYSSVLVFQCANGNVIDSSMVCDGYDDCRDGSDEFIGCPCLPFQRACQSGKCLPKEWFCDSFIDCDDRSDEAGCSHCTANQFTCRSYQCIAQSAVCDGVSQCNDGTDERGCLSVDTAGLVQALCFESQLPDSSGLQRQTCSICSSPWSADWSRQLCVEAGRGPIVSTFTQSVSVATSRRLLKLNESFNTPYLIGSLRPTASCDNNTVLGIVCRQIQCGTSARVSSFAVGLIAYILGGNIVVDGSDWPWMAAVSFTNTFTGGGTLISNQWVITAGHMFVVVNSRGQVSRLDEMPRLFGLTMGSSYLVDQSNITVAANISRVYVHPGYFRNATSLSNDAALLLLEQPVRPTATVQAACLPAANASLSLASTCYLTGWGSTDGNAESSANQLREAKMRLLNDAVCLAAWPRSFVPGLHLCAGYDSGLPAGCNGDSGGPLVCLDSAAGHWVLTGIMSFGGACRNSVVNKPNVFTKVSALMPWISGIMAATQSSP